MKEPLKDRIDILIESAKNGNSEAQLKLSKCFYEGHLVEKSTENALYWSFKAVSAGVPEAENYYRAIGRGAKLPISDNMRKFISLIGNLEIVPIWEFLIGFIGFVIFSKVEALQNIMIWLFITGLVSGILAYIVKKVYNFFVKGKDIDLSAIITILVVHVISIYLGISMLVS